MASLYDYVLSVKDKSFAEVPLCLLDFTLFNELTYLQIMEHVPKAIRQKDVISIQELKKVFHYDDQGIPIKLLNTPERIRLFNLFLMAKRYQKIQFCHYKNEVNLEFETQFLAMVFDISECQTHHIVFGGTDDSLVGWKENFKLSYMREIPAHRTSSAYLHQVLPQLRGRIVISGHSKGGNLAAYAVSQIPRDLQDYIDLIYIFDAPGFRKPLLESEGYQYISHKMITIKPYESLIGMILETNKIPIVVASDAKGIIQHAMSKWKVDIKNNQFQQVPTLSPLSLQFEKTFALWTQSLSNYELKSLIDLLFDEFIDRGVLSFEELVTKNPLVLRQYLAIYRRLSPYQRQLFLKAINLFIKAYRSSHLTLKETSSDKKSTISQLLNTIQTKKTDTP
ncbi:Mbeg1-like protein [Streptococcus pluranimalium]|uniref:Mbeg1-like protein n=1 Tax=Streptococcus pluranimalium TaxID=82348 RepID=UPI0039FC7F0D